FDEISFPNAKYMISEREWNFWMSADILKSLPKERHGFAVGAQRNLKAIRERLSTIKAGQEVLSGISAIDTSGHTPGHISLEVGRGTDKLVILGDALTHPVISFQHPDWQPASDQIPDQAVATRKVLLDKIASERSRIVGYHLPTPGLGRVRRKGAAYEYLPGA
ncbi:MAG: MBL fold metallo-hydrolase, partial [Hyphomicrobiaceae bacterium]